MNRITITIMYFISFFCLLQLIISCTDLSLSSDTNVNELSVVLVNNVATVTWKGIADAQHYILEVLDSDNNNNVVYIENEAKKALLESYSRDVALARGRYTFNVWAQRQNERTKVGTKENLVVETKAERPAKSLVNDPTVDRDKKELRLSWAPVDAGKAHNGADATIQNYTVYWNEGDSVDSTSTNSRTTDKTEMIIPGLAGGKKYSIIVLAKNSAGIRGLPSAKKELQLSWATQPDPAKIKEISIGQGSFTISWDFPDKSGSTAEGETASIAGYIIYWKKGTSVDSSSSSAVISSTENTDSFNTRKHTISVQQGTGTYTTMLLAKNNADQLSPESSATSININAETITEISTWQQLQNIGSNQENSLAKHYKLKNDIVFPSPGTNTFPTAGFTPIGSEGSPFTGTFDGNGKTIKDLFIKDNVLNYAGLFGVVSASNEKVKVIHDLTIENPQITAKFAIAALAGSLEKGIVSNITIKNATASKIEQGVEYTKHVTSTSNIALSAIGGVIGIVKQEATLASASNEFQIHTPQSASGVGGLVGYNAGDVSGIVTTKQLIEKKYSTNMIGGLVGYNVGDVSGIVMGGHVDAANQVGGLVGHNSGRVSGYVTGDVTGLGQQVGGLVGRNTGIVTGYATGLVTGDSKVGGLVGENKDTGTVTGYATGLVTGDSEIGGLVGENGGIVKGYALGYVTTTGTNSENYGPSIGEQSVSTRSTVYVGRSQAEEEAEKKTAGKGDHVAKGTSTGEAPTRIIIEGSGTNTANTFYSQNQASFEKEDSSLTFGSKDWQWKKDYATTWPILNIPTRITSLSGYVEQDPKIITPTGFTE